MHPLLVAALAGSAVALAAASGGGDDDGFVLRAPLPEYTFVPPPPDRFEWVASPEGWKSVGQRLRAGTMEDGGVFIDTNLIDLGTLYIKSSPGGAWCIKEWHFADVLALLTYLPQWRNWEKEASCGRGKLWVVRYPWLTSLIGPKADWKTVWDSVTAIGAMLTAAFAQQWGAAVAGAVASVREVIQNLERSKAAAKLTGAASNQLVGMIASHPLNAHLREPNGNLNLHKQFIAPGLITQAMAQGATADEGRAMRSQSGEFRPLVFLPNEA